MNADGLGLILSICRLNADEMRVGLLIKAGAQGQHSLIRFIQSLQQLQPTDRMHTMVIPRFEPACKFHGILEIPLGQFQPSVGSKRAHGTTAVLLCKSPDVCDMIMFFCLILYDKYNTSGWRVLGILMQVLLASRSTTSPCTEGSVYR